MRRHVFAAGIMIFVMSLFVGGAAAAYFTDEVFLPIAEFTTGTVDIEIEEKSSNIKETNDGYKGTVKWEIENTGTKRAYLRAKPHWNLDGEGECELTGKEETGWGEGSGYEYIPGWGMYFTYNIGDPPKSVILKAGQHIDAGILNISSDDSFVYVEYNTTSSNWIIGKTDLLVCNDLPDSMLGIGKFPYNDDVAYWISNRKVLYIIPQSDFDVERQLYIAAHADLLECIGGCTVPDIDIDVKGWTKGEDGYYYYDGIVEPGKSVSFKVEFEVEADGGWSGSCSFWLEDVEAVQASHGAIHYVWPENPWKD